jgi:hypothetical protein
VSPLGRSEDLSLPLRRFGTARSSDASVVDVREIDSRVHAGLHEPDKGSGTTIGAAARRSFNYLPLSGRAASGTAGVENRKAELL